jgi:hypothetical protein
LSQTSKGSVSLALAGHLKWSAESKSGHRSGCAKWVWMALEITWLEPSRWKRIFLASIVFPIVVISATS